MPRLDGKRVVLTGGSDGIGLTIARRLAAAGAELILPARNRAKAEAAQSRIAEVVTHPHITIYDLDLSSLDSVRRLSEQLLDDGRAIDLLINNAGVMTPPLRQTTKDGFELQFGTNHLGHFALVGRLLPLLKAGAARVSSQVSIAANRGKVNWDDPNWERHYEGMPAYSQSKIALGLFGLELDRRSREAGWGIDSNLSHPGVAPTSLLAARAELGRAKQPFGRRVIGWLSSAGILLGTAESAGLPALMAATAPHAGGRFFSPSGPAHLGGAPGEEELYSRLTSLEEAKRMWALSEEMTGVRF